MKQHLPVTAPDADLHALLAHLQAQLPPTWDAWPGGWPDQVEFALIDAVLSIRSRYGGPTTGVRRRVGLYREHRAPETPDDLPVLGALDPERLATLLRTRQRTSGTLKGRRDHGGRPGTVRTSPRSTVAIFTPRCSDHGAPVSVGETRRNLKHAASTRGSAGTARPGVERRATSRTACPLRPTPGPVEGAARPWCGR